MAFRFDHLVAGASRNIRRSAALLALAGAAAAAPAGAQDLRFELGLPETSPFGAPLVRFAEKLKEVGINATVSNGSILSLAEVCHGLRDGLVDGGLCLFPYNPAEFADSNLISTMSMFATSGTPADNPAAAMTGAIMEYVLLNCPDCQEEIAAQNFVFIGSSSTPPYDTLCRDGKQIASVADFAGKRIRSGGANYTRIAEAFGATSVTMKGAEVFDALDKGVIDCIMVAVSELITLRLVEVTDQALLGWPGGVFAGQALPGINLDTWRSLSAEQRAFMIRAGAEIAADGVINFDKGNEAGLAAGREKGMTFTEANEEIRAKTVEFLQSDVEAIRKEFAEQYRVENVEAKMALAQDLIEKWKGLTNGALTEEKLSQLYWDNIHSRIDAATYAMN